ncbi:MAG: hypothetical protein ACODAC_01795 [Pseudomonadota bacterium]
MSAQACHEIRLWRSVGERTNAVMQFTLFMLIAYLSPWLCRGLVVLTIVGLLLIV